MALTSLNFSHKFDGKNVGFKSISWYREVPGINICLACLVFENLDGNRGLKARASGGHCHDKSISLTVNEIDLSWHVRS